MAEKLNTGDSFPELTLDVVDGSKLTLPHDLDARYKVVLFYRGHW
jgi:peroxiredoxin